MNYDFESLESLLFNPIDQAGCKSSFNSHLDPDSNFPFCPPESDYLVEEEINARVASKQNKPSFSFLHLNARILAGHFDKFKMLLSRLSVSFPVIGVTETWLSDLTTDSVDISGFKFLSNHRTNKNCGGTGLYLQDNLEYKLRPDCNYSDPEVIESLFVELDIPRGKNIVVGVVYRPPNQNLSAFLAVFNEILSNITRGGKTCYVAGDYNLDILHYNDHAQTQEFVDNLFSHMLLPLITKPTRRLILFMLGNLCINTKTVCFHPFFLMYFKLAAKSIITILGLPPVFVLTNVEAILSNLLSFFKVLRYGMLSLPH